MIQKNYPKSEKRPYQSPTTPGLYVSIRDYIIELICLNVNPRIGPRFWSDQNYWAPKYKREVKGVSNLSRQLDLTNALTQTALIQIIKEYRIKALIAKKTNERVIRLTYHRIELLKKQRMLLANDQPPAIFDIKKNSTIIDIGEKNTPAKIRKIENG